MAGERSILIYSQVSEAEQKFDYFLTGLIGALCGYIGQNFVSTKLGWNSATIELVAILILVSSFCCSLWRILLHIAIKGINADALHINEAKQKLIIASKHGQPKGPTDNDFIRDDSTGMVIPMSEVPKAIETISNFEKEMTELMAAKQKKAKITGIFRASFLIVGFLTLIFSRVSKAYDGAAESFAGKCVGISDGDIISVMHDGKAEKIRLAGIDCPEKSQDFGEKAKKFTSGLVFNKNVGVEVQDHDQYNRTVGVVTVGKVNVNRELVKNGMAWNYVKYSNDKTLADLEAEARKNHVGLWCVTNQVPPWEFRKRQKAK